MAFQEPLWWTCIYVKPCKVTWGKIWHECLKTIYAWPIYWWVLSVYMMPVLHLMLMHLIHGASPDLHPLDWHEHWAGPNNVTSNPAAIQAWWFSQVTLALHSWEGETVCVSHLDLKYTILILTFCLEIIQDFIVGTKTLPRRIWAGW